MKKKLVLFLFSLCASLCFSQNVLSGVHHGPSVPSEGPYFAFSPEQGVFGAVALNSHASFEPYVVSFQLGWHFDAPSAAFTAAMHLARESIQLAGEGIWYPLRFDRVRAGIGGSLDIFFDSVYASELNVIPGAYVEFRPCGWFMLSAHADYMLKARAIYSIAQDVGMVLNHTVSMGLRLHFYVPGGFTFYAGGDTDELFRYMIFCAPTFTLGAAYTTGSLTFMAEANVRYIDFFTASAMYDGTEVRALVRYRL